MVVYTSCSVTPAMFFMWMSYFCPAVVGGGPRRPHHGVTSMPGIFNKLGRGQFEKDSETGNFKPINVSDKVPPVKSVESPMLKVDGGHLSMQVPIFPLDDNGYFIMPPNATLTIEIGTHAESTARFRMEQDPSAVVIGFEPDPEQWARLLLKQPFNHRFRVIQAAVGARSRQGFHRLYQWTSSNKMNKNYDKSESELGSLSVHYSAILADYVTVPVIPLEDILERVRPDVRIEMIKIDAQGLDLEIALSAGKQISRVERFQMEVNHGIKLYNESASRKEVVATIKELGFEQERCWKAFADEDDCVFARRDLLATVLHEDQCFSKEFMKVFLKEMHPRGVYNYAELMYGLSDKGYIQSGMETPEVEAHLVGGLCCDKRMWTDGAGCFDIGNNSLRQWELHTNPVIHLISHETCCVEEYMEKIGLLDPLRVF